MIDSYHERLSVQESDQFEIIHEVDGRLEALNRQGVTDGPRVALLKRRRLAAQTQLREIQAWLDYFHTPGVY